MFYFPEHFFVWWISSYQRSLADEIADIVFP